MTALAWILLGAATIVGVGVAGAALYLAIFLPFTARSARLLEGPARKTVDGITTIDDAVAACRASGLDGVDLVAFAQSLAARRFEYSRRNPWDSWERCFERGRGYCIQQAMALKILYDRLGITARPVQSLRCAFPGSVVHGASQPAMVSGHMWLRVRVGDHEYDVCPGRVANAPGRVHFTSLAPVRAVPRWLLPVLHVFSAAENVRRDWHMLWAGTPVEEAPRAKA